MYIEQTKLYFKVASLDSQINGGSGTHFFFFFLNYLLIYFCCALLHKFSVCVAGKYKYIMY